MRLKIRELAYVVGHPEPVNGPALGPVHASVLSPRGEVLDVIALPEHAGDGPFLAERLTGCIQKLGTSPGPPLTVYRQRPRSRPRPADLVLSVIVRFLLKPVDIHKAIRSLDGSASAPGRSLLTRLKNPIRDQVVLPAEKWRKLVPSPVRTGTQHEVDAGAASTILMHFCPPTDMLVLDSARIIKASLRSEVSSVSGDTATVRLDGAITMRHPWGREVDSSGARTATSTEKKWVQATVLGFIQFDRRRQRIRSLQMTTRTARYRGESFSIPYGVAVQSMPQGPNLHEEDVADARARP